MLKSRMCVARPDRRWAMAWIAEISRSANVLPRRAACGDDAFVGAVTKSIDTSTRRRRRFPSARPCVACDRGRMSELCEPRESAAAHRWTTCWRHVARLHTDGETARSRRDGVQPLEYRAVVSANPRTATASARLRAQVLPASRASSTRHLPAALQQRSFGLEVLFEVTLDDLADHRTRRGGAGEHGEARPPNVLAAAPPVLGVRSWHLIRIGPRRLA